MPLAAGTYALDPAHTVIGFVAKHAMVTKVRGNFADFEGTITVAENIAESAAEATIRTASITTGNDDRDAHVKNEDFFAVEQYPEITFKTTNLNVDENGNGTVTGNLTVLLQSWAESRDDPVSHFLMAAACRRSQAVSKTRLTITASGLGYP